MNNYLIFKREIESEMGPGNAVVRFAFGDTYMQGLEQGDFSIDAYPFGGFTGIVDALHVGKPIITWEGDRCYNMSASRLLKKAGLDELVATSEEEYIAKACRLADDEAYRADLVSRIRDLDLYEMMFDPREADYFKQAIDYVITNHETLRQDTSREPIIIPQ